MKELSAEKETSTSKTRKEFCKICESIKRKYNFTIQLASIKGRRWSYLCGGKAEDISFTPPERIQLNKDFGVIIYNWENIIEAQQKEILDLLKEI